MPMQAMSQFDSALKWGLSFWSMAQPRSAIQQEAHVADADAEPVSDLLLQHARATQSEYLSDVFRLQLGNAAPRSESGAILSRHILRVVLCCADEQMVRSHATWVVTGVAQATVVWNP